MVCNILTWRILAFFDKTSIFNFFDIVIIQVFPDPEATKPPQGFENKLLKNFFYSSSDLIHF